MLLYATAKEGYNSREANRLRVEKHRAVQKCNANVQDLTKEFKSCILFNNPKAKITDKQISIWEREADLLLRVDHRDFDEALEILAWCQQDKFWRTNILSMGKFRKQYDQLTLKMEADPAWLKRAARKQREQAKAPVCAHCGYNEMLHRLKASFKAGKSIPTPATQWIIESQKDQKTVCESFRENEA